jgi:hypothetical protein
MIEKKIALIHFRVKFTGHNHLLEIRLLETGFLILFQPNPKIRCLVLDNLKKKKFLVKKYLIFLLVRLG